MKKARKIHLWIGLITSLLLFFQASTGLILMEPWIVGIEKNGQGQGWIQLEESRKGRVVDENENNNIQGNEYGFNRQDNEDQGLHGIIKELHTGQIGNHDLSIVIDLTAVSIMILTATGIYLSIKILRGEHKRKKGKIISGEVPNVQ